MTATIFPRELGVKLTCNKCGATEQTAMCGKGRNRDWFKSKGWGRGSDPGLPARDALPERETTFMLRGAEVTRKLPATAGTPGRVSTISHDLCPVCLKLDRESAKERKVTRDKQIAARDLKRKERDVAARHAMAQAEADSR